jgi:hypothetical protein
MRLSRIALCPMLLALLLGVASGCFVGDELNQAKHLSDGNRPAGAPSAPAPAAGKDAAAKPGSGDPAKPPALSGAAWWKTAKSLTSESADASISPCELRGRVEYMLHEDCLARGGRTR